MLRVIGIDEAGYGPNLGPLVQVAVAMRVPDDGCLWRRLAKIVRRGSDADDGRILFDDSKVVNAGPDGKAQLELGVLSCLQNRPLREWFDADMSLDPWFNGSEIGPVAVDQPTICAAQQQWQHAAVEDVAIDAVEVVVTPARRFNEITSRTGSKASVLADGVANLVKAIRGEAAATFIIDKHGGRHFYAAFVQSIFPDAWVSTVCESPTSSRYRVGERWHFDFRPRAEQHCLAVALASMTAKYLRERLMRQFNRFWQKHVPDLMPTAGYPGDSKRYYEAIKPVMKKLGMAADDVWRRK